jgi:amino acid transporter
MIILILAALVPAAFIVFLAFSKKSSPGVRKASIIALVIIGLAFAACSVLVILFGLPAGGTGTANPEIPITPVPEGKQDIVTILIVAAVVISFMTIVIILSIREQRRINKITHKQQE